MFDDLTLQQYRTLKDDVAVASLSGCLVKLTGGDRHKFLNNFSTNDILKLPALATCEALILDGKGKILHHVHVLNGADALWLYSIADDAVAMMEHLDKYLLRDDVQMAEVDGIQAKFVAGPNMDDALKDLLPSPLPQNHIAELPDSLIVAHVELAGWGYLMLSPEAIAVDHVAPVDAAALAAVRIEHQTPWMGVDIDSSNLPQELLRDEKCISFTKGCYLGQETVARIDAIGRVNRVIALVQSKDAVSPGDDLLLNEKKVGSVLSVTWSPEHSAYVALAMVRRPHEKSGTQLLNGEVTVTVV